MHYQNRDVAIQAAIGMAAKTNAPHYVIEFAQNRWEVMGWNPDKAVWDRYRVIEMTPDAARKFLAKMKPKDAPPLARPPDPNGLSAPIQEAVAKAGERAQELANRHGHAYAMVTSDHDGKAVIHIRPRGQVGKNEKIIAVFHPDEDPNELPGLHPDDFEYWMQAVELAWAVVRHFHLGIKTIEPKPRPLVGGSTTVAYDNSSRLVIAVRLKDPSENDEWNDDRVPMTEIVSSLAHTLGNAWQWGENVATMQADIQAWGEAWLSNRLAVV
jgi:hypothetical protein